MQLISLQTIQFRNSVHVDGPFARVNGIFGPNGRGKTNFLEAIYYLSHFKSWRSSAKRDLIGWAHEEAALTARFESAGQTHDLRIHIFPTRREVILDGKALRSWENYSARLIAVLFSPEDTYLFRAGPELRRHALDRMLFHRDAGYAVLLRRYEKSVRQKNALLKTEIIDDKALAVWNEQLVKYGSELIFHRKAYLRDIAPRLKKFYSSIARTAGECIGVVISTQMMGDDEATSVLELETLFREALAKHETLERIRRVALVGPHRDDWGVQLDGQAAATSASQGEHRSLVIALKLAEIELLKEEKGEAPLFLLDDVASELDPDRRRFLIETLLQSGAQIFLTSAESEPFLSFLPAGSRIIEFQELWGVAQQPQQGTCPLHPNNLGVKG